MNSPKMYFITKDGKFFNSRDNHWYSNHIHANFERKKEGLEALLKTDKFKECEIFTTTEDEFMGEMARLTTDLVISGEYLTNRLEKLAFKLPTISHVNKILYQKLKVAIECLKPFSKMHKEFLEVKEDFTDDVSAYYANYIQSVSSVEIYETTDIVAIIEAYHKDKKSITGIAKKILNN